VDDAGVVYSRGRAVREQACAETIDLAAVQGKLRGGVDAAAFYEAYRRSGVEYGPVFRGVSALWSGMAKLWADRVRGVGADGGPSGRGAAVLRGGGRIARAGGASLRGGRLRAVCEASGAVLRACAGAGRGPLACSAGRSRGPCAGPRGGFFRARGRCDRRAGGTCLRTRLLYLPHWRHAPLEQASSRPAGVRTLLIGGGDLADELAAAGPVVRALRPGEAPERVYVLGQSLAAGEWLAALQSLAQEHGDRELDLFVANPHTPDGAALAGFTASLAREYPRWRVRNLLYDRPRGVAQHLAAEPASANGSGR